MDTTKQVCSYVGRYCQYGRIGFFDVFILL